LLLGPRVIDCFFRRLVGQSIAERVRTELVADPLRYADGATSIA
jgi:hypothetical protein